MRFIAKAARHVALIGAFAGLLLAAPSRLAAADESFLQAYLVFGNWFCANWFCYGPYCCTVIIMA